MLPLRNYLSSTTSQPLRPHHQQCLDITYSVRVSSSPENLGNVLTAVDLKPQPPNLVADDLSATPSRIFGEHQVQLHFLSLLPITAWLTVARSASEPEPVAPPLVDPTCQGHISDTQAPHQCFALSHHHVAARVSFRANAYPPSVLLREPRPPWMLTNLWTESVDYRAHMS